MNTGYIYVLFDVKNKISRIGKTKNKNFKRPLSQVGYYPYPLLMFCYLVDNYNDVEIELHNHFKENKINGDWYNIKVENILKHIDENYDWSLFDAPSYQNILKTLVKVK